VLPEEHAWTEARAQAWWAENVVTEKTEIQAISEAPTFLLPSVDQSL
jgi:hypothetical protein